VFPVQRVLENTVVEVRDDQGMNADFARKTFVREIKVLHDVICISWAYSCELGIVGSSWGLGKDL
jgi:hypothetical protein